MLEVPLKGLNVNEIDDSLEPLLIGTMDININYYPPCPNPDPGYLCLHHNKMQAKWHQNQVLEYQKWAKLLAKKLLEVLLKGLTVNEIDESIEPLLMETMAININNYPPFPNPSIAIGASPTLRRVLHHSTLPGRHGRPICLRV
uniref:2-oxoglutarate-dependent dioxygenase n=1 Tax=Solanum tuberosum TaxID=4113 RepID=M1DGB4_SOLTU